MSLEGTLGERELKEVLGTLSLHARTGILTVQGEREIIAIALQGGEVVSADALNQSLENGLGRVLAELDLVKPADFAGLAAEHQSGGGRVVDLVVERGFVDRGQLLGALRQHIYRLCRQAISWQEGEFKFYQGEEVSYESDLTPIPVDELFARVVHDLGDPELAAGRFPDGGTICARGGTETARELTSLDPALLERLGIEAGEVVSALDGRRSAAEVAAATGIAEHKVLYALFHLEREGVVEEVGQKEEPETDTELMAPPQPYALAMAEAEKRRPVSERLGSALERLRLAIRGSELWPARLAGLGLAAVLLTIAIASPVRIALPFRHEQPVRNGIAAARAAVAELRLHRAAVTFHLLRGHFPEQGETLVDLGLVSLADLRGRGGPRSFSSTALSYVFQSGDDRMVGGAVTGSITGNFLLDPDFGVGEVSAEAPLVLLD